jgi:hypothetical protein
MPTVTTQVKTRRYRSSLWLKGNAFVASLIPLLIYVVINGVLFWLFFQPFATAFPSLFPISQYLWFPLILLILNVGLLILKKDYSDDYRRQTLFTEFCTKTTGLAMLQTRDKQQLLSSLPLLYVLFHRKDANSLAATESLTEALRFAVNAQSPENRMPFLISRFSMVDNKLATDMIGIWLQSSRLEEQTRPITLFSIAYVSVWLFVLSIPFVLWSNYSWYGFFGVLMVAWPVLAYIYGPAPLTVTNQFESCERSAFIRTDYEKLARECGELVRNLGMEVTTDSLGRKFH